MHVLDTELGLFRSWPSQHRSKIQKGPLQGTIGAVDTFPICTHQPAAKEDRKKYFIYKPGHHTRYGWKVQTFVDLHGRILDVTDAHPFGSVSDIRLFRESRVPGKLDAKNRAMAPPSVNLVSQIEKRIGLAATMRGAKSDVENSGDANETDEGKMNTEENESQAEYSQNEPHSIKTISTALSRALGDKAYQGDALVYVPYKRYKTKRFTRKMKEFNKLLGSKRVIVENVNKRLEDWKVLGTIYRGKRDYESVSRVVRVVVSLYNYTLGEHPLRKGRKKS